VHTPLLHSRRHDAARTSMSCRPRHARGSWLGAAWIGSWRDWGARRDERERIPFGWVSTRRAWRRDRCGDNDESGDRIIIQRERRIRKVEE
jgi:hypothetical protein